MNQVIRRMMLVVGFTLVVAMATPIARGHDLWLVPHDAVAVGRPASIRANSGMEFPKSEHAPDPTAFAKRIVIGPDGAEIKLEPAGQDESARSGLLAFTPNRPGIHVIAVETRPKLITLTADEFNEYLVADGLPHIFRMRAKEKSLDQPACERYSKFPKALIRVADASGATPRAAGGDPSRALGMTLEIVPLADPFVLKVSDTLRVRVLFRDEPLANANLGWDHADDGEHPRGTTRTNARGEALVPIARTGLMTIRLTHMTRPKTDEFEWESFWTTLTFRIPD